MTFDIDFLGVLKQPTHCNSCMMCTTNNISVDALDLQQQRILPSTTVVTITTIPYNDTNNIIYDLCNVLDVMWDWRYGMIFGLDCNNKIVDQ